MAGMVYLVGAGPGDYRLVSIKAVDCLKQADVVVYDRLADDRILNGHLQAPNIFMLAKHQAITR